MCPGMAERFLYNKGKGNIISNMFCKYHIIENFSTNVHCSEWNKNLWELPENKNITLKNTLISLLGWGLRGAWILTIRFPPKIIRISSYNLRKNPWMTYTGFDVHGRVGSLQTGCSLFLTFYMRFDFLFILGWLISRGCFACLLIRNLMIRFSLFVEWDQGRHLGNHFTVAFRAFPH